jgi:hypothetical protein
MTTLKLEGKVGDGGFFAKIDITAPVPSAREVNISPLPSSSL